MEKPQQTFPLFFFLNMRKTQGTTHKKWMLLIDTTMAERNQDHFSKPHHGTTVQKERERETNL